MSPSFIRKVQNEAWASILSTPSPKQLLILQSSLEKDKGEMGGERDRQFSLLLVCSRALINSKLNSAAILNNKELSCSSFHCPLSREILRLQPDLWQPGNGWLRPQLLL